MMELQNPKSSQRIKILHQSHNHPLYLITMGFNNSIIDYKFKYILRAKFFLTLRMLDKSLSAHPLPFCTKLGNRSLYYGK